MKISKRRKITSSKETADRKTDRRISPTNVRYRGYMIRLDRGGDGYNVYDKHGELEDAGYTSLESAKKLVDELVSEAGDKIESSVDIDEETEDPGIAEAFIRTNVNDCSNVTASLNYVTPEMKQLKRAVSKISVDNDDQFHELVDSLLINEPINLVPETRALKRAIDSLVVDSEEERRTLVYEVAKDLGVINSSSNVDVYSASYNESGIYEETEDPKWICLDIKHVRDSDGMLTDYALYTTKDEDKYICMFGDADVYAPDEMYADAEFDTEDEALEWFENYVGPGDEEDEEDEHYDILESTEAIKEGIDGTLNKLGGPETFRSELMATIEAYPGIEDDIEELADMMYGSYKGVISIEELESAIEYMIDDALESTEAVNSSYSPELLDDLVNFYSSFDTMSYEEIWDEIVAEYNNEALANDVLESLDHEEDVDLVDEEGAYDVYSSSDIKASMGRYDEYYGQTAAATYGDLIADRLKGKSVSKRRDTANEPGGLIYEANKLGIDMWDLLEALEGMCNEGRAREIDDSTYKILGASDLADEDDLEHPDQEYDSAATSINSTKLPAIYRMIKLQPGTVGVDFGGGRFDNAVEYLRDQDVTLCVYDPYNRSAEHNREVLRTLRANGGADFAINSNVLNVIKEPEARKGVLENIKKITKSGAPIYITVYEGRGDAKEGVTKSGYQLNRKTADYLEEIQEVFPDAKRKGKLIVATNKGSANSSVDIKASSEIIWDDLDWNQQIQVMKRYIRNYKGTRIFEDFADYINKPVEDIIDSFTDAESHEDIKIPERMQLDSEYRNDDIYSSDSVNVSTDEYTERWAQRNIKDDIEAAISNLSFYCPRCHNKTLYSVENEIRSPMDVDYREIFVCDECASEFEAYPQYDGSIKFKEYHGAHDVDDEYIDSSTDITAAYKLWMGKYKSAKDNKMHKVYFEFDTSDFEEAEQEFEDIIPEPYSYARLLGTAPHEALLQKDGFEKIQSSSSVSSRYWYFTRHGVQPGSVPKYVNILDIVDKPEGSYFLADGVILTKDLRDYDIKERKPEDSVTSSTLIKSKGNTNEYSDILEEIREQCNTKLIHIMAQYGFDESESKQYSRVDASIEDNQYGRIEIGCELDYDGLMKVCQELDPIVQAYDPDSYFEPVDSGIAEAWVNLEKASIDSSSNIQAGAYDFPEPSLDPPEYPEPEEVDDYTQKIDLNLDAVIEIDQLGNWDYQDENYPWARCKDTKDGSWYSDEYNVFIADPVSIVERVDELLISKLPEKEGTYRIKGNVHLEYVVSNLSKYVHSYGPDDYEEDIDTDNAYVDFDFYNSNISDFRLTKI